MRQLVGVYKMIKNPATKIQETEESRIRSSPKKKETLCVDKRRDYSHCGICGSSNLATEGVKFCNICGEEIDYLVEGRGGWFLEKDIPKYPDCGCKKPIEANELRKVNKKKSTVRVTRYVNDLGHHHVTHCLDCGAVNSIICPACKKNCWGKEFQRYCRYCGYRSL